MKISPYFKWFLIINLGIVAIKILYVIYGHLDLFTEETQYWLWSQNPDLSYYSKPPLISWLNSISTGILGNTEIGVRINAIVIGFIICLVIFQFYKVLFKDEKGALLASLFVYGIPFFNIATLMFTTDTPLCLFFLLTTFYFWKAINDTKPINWIMTGVFAGLGFLSKYTMLFFLPGAVIFLFLYKKEIFKQKWLYFSILIALVISLPVLVWNIQQDFITFKHVTSINNEGGDGYNFSVFLSNIGEYIGGQIAFISVFLLPFILIGIVRAFKEKNLALIYLSLNAIFTFSFFLLLVIFFAKRIEVNWTIYAYLTLPIIGVRTILQIKKLKLAIILFAISTFFNSLLFASPLLDKIGIGKFYPPKSDAVIRTIGWEDLGEELTQIKDSLNTDKVFIFSNNYHLASEMAFYVKDNPQTYCINIGRRANQFDIWPGLEQFEEKEYYGIFIAGYKPPKIVRDGFDKVISTRKYEVSFRGEVIKTYYISVLENYHRINEQKIITY